MTTLKITADGQLPMGSWVVEDYHSYEVSRVYPGRANARTSTYFDKATIDRLLRASKAEPRWWNTGLRLGELRHTPPTAFTYPDACVSTNRGAHVARVSIGDLKRAVRYLGRMLDRPIAAFAALEYLWVMPNKSSMWGYPVCGLPDELIHVSPGVLRGVVDAKPTGNVTLYQSHAEFMDGSVRSSPARTYDGKMYKWIALSLATHGEAMPVTKRDHPAELLLEDWNYFWRYKPARFAATLYLTDSFGLLRGTDGRICLTAKLIKEIS